MSLIKCLPEQAVLDLINALQKSPSDEGIKSLNEIFKELIESNIHLEAIKLLLVNDKVDFGTGNNRAIGWASKNGHSEVVKLLLANDKVNPSTDNNFAIKWSFGSS